MPSAIRVLIVDDNPLIRCYLEHMLNLQDGFEVIGDAENGQCGVALAQQLLPDAIVMDCEMPVMDGIEATRRITATCPRVSIVGYTSRTDDAVLESMREAGAVAYVPKHAPIFDLIAAIREATRCASPFTGVVP